mmetsp:Transcript_3545/g.5516  ORF Transcript_3545/g.5516 Transcript_3545/m.5516 type:complete len:253 (-) Transcript_3545:2092-2850(-)
MVSHMGVSEAVLCVGSDRNFRPWSLSLSQPRNVSSSSLRHRSARPSMPRSVKFEQSVRLRTCRDVSMFSFAARRPSRVALNQNASSFSRKMSSRFRFCRYQQLEHTARTPRSETRDKPVMLSRRRAGQLSARQMMLWSVRSRQRLMSILVMFFPLPTCTMAAHTSAKDSSLSRVPDICRELSIGLFFTIGSNVFSVIFGHLFTFTCTSFVHLSTMVENPSSEMRLIPSMEIICNFTYSERMDFKPRSLISGQ